MGPAAQEALAPACCEDLLTQPATVPCWPTAAGAAVAGSPSAAAAECASSSTWSNLLALWTLTLQLLLLPDQLLPAGISCCSLPDCDDENTAGEGVDGGAAWDQCGV